MATKSKSPIKKSQKSDPLARVRELCLALPETTEKLAWGEPTFRVKKKLFAMYTDNHHNDGRIALWLNMPEGAQEMLLASDPEVFFYPPYVGHSGWIGVRLDRQLAWKTVAELIRDAWRKTAPARLAASLS
jgi:hypothetical protein